MGMDNKILYKNLNALKERYPELVADFAKCQEQKVEDDSTFLDKSADGEYIAGVVKDGRDWYLNSRYSPQKAAKEWAGQYVDMNFQTIFVILGFANGMHIRELLKNLQKTNNIMVYEPDKNLFYMVLREIDIADILLDKRLYLSVKGVNDSNAIEFITLLLDYSNMRLLEYNSLPDYDIIYQEDWRDIMKKIKERVEIIVINRNTQISFKHEFIVNMFMNYRDMVGQYTINQLKEAFSDVDFDNIPAIVVSAGPSLDKNIMELKNAKGKSFIICVDTAANAMLKAGIEPDIVVTVDPHKPVALFRSLAGHNIPMVVSQYSNKEVILTTDSKKFYMGENDYISTIYQKYGREMPMPLESGGSVANNAFSLARYIGFKTIILVGQDLAYTGNKKHTSDAYDAGNTFIKEMEQSDDYEQVDAIDGGKVWTKGNMKLYINWFENQFIIHRELKVIDATEGGALKRGSIIQSLKDSIEAECRGQYDFRKKIDSIETVFTKSEQEEIKALFNNIGEEIVKQQGKMREGVRLYERMYELYKKGRNGTKEYKKLLKDIEKINYHTDNEPMLALASVYNAADNYEVQGEIYHVMDNADDEVKAITDLGIKMLKSYDNALEKMKEDVKYLNGDVILQELIKKCKFSLIQIDFTSYAYRKQDMLNANKHYKSATIQLEMFMKLLPQCHSVLKKSGVMVDEAAISGTLVQMYEALRDNDFVLLTDFMQYQLKPLLLNLMLQLNSLNLIEEDNFEDMNMEACEAYNGVLYNQLKRFNQMPQNYETEITSYGCVTVRNVPGKVYLHTTQNPNLEARLQFDSIDIKPDEQIAVLGFGMGYLYNEFFRRRVPNEVYFYEPNMEILKHAFKSLFLVNTLKKKNLHIVYDPDLRHFAAKIKQDNVNVFFHKPSVKCIRDERMVKIVEELEMQIMSVKQQGMMLENNLAKNLAAVEKVLDDEMCNIKGKTYIYVAGGESLDNDMEELAKQATRDETIIVSSGTVYKKLLKAGIEPDYVIITDAKSSIITQIDNTECGHTRLLYLSTVDKCVTDSWKGEKYIVFQEGMEKAEMYARQNKYTLISTGGSVSTAAIDIGIRMKASRIVCVGLDLAYISDKTHAAGTHEKRIADTASMRKVKGIDGRELPTAANLDVYRKWIERRIKDVKEVEFINCSGGAYINGMKHMRLADI